MRFDWYQATIEADIFSVLAEVEKLGDEVVRDDSIAKRYRYSEGVAVHHRERGLVARVFWGDNGKYPHALASGQDTDDFVDLVRSKWAGKHIVTRFDAAEDFHDSKGYDRLLKVTKRVAKDHRLQFPSIQDDLNPIAGRTQYIGGKTSDYRGRLYEKGWEVVQKSAALRGEYVSDHHGVILNEVTGEFVNPADWVRLELQGRPKGEAARRAAALATPEQAWTFTSWSADLAERALSLEMERFFIRTRKLSKDSEAILWLARQYGPLLTRRFLALGSWESVGAELADIISRQSRNKL